MDLESLLEELGFESIEELRESVSLSTDTAKEVKELRVKNLVSEWQNEGVPAAVIEEARNIALADDGKPALLLSTDEDGEKTITATQIVERLVAATPRVNLEDLRPSGNGNQVREDDDEKKELTLDQKVDALEAFLRGEGDAPAFPSVEEVSSNGDGEE